MDQYLTAPLDFAPDASTLYDKTVLITGASSEIGSALSFCAAKSGATVLMLDKKQRNLAPQYDAIVNLGLPEPMMIEFDTAKADSQAFENLGTSLMEVMPEIHGLVHCAMWSAPLTPIAHAELPTWEKVVSQHLIKPMLLTKTLYPRLNHPNPASIVFTSMGIGRFGCAYWGAMGAAFAGIENLSETLNAEYADYNIRVNTLDTGKVKTAIRKHFYPDENINDLREANDTKLMNTYIYLLSDQSEHLSACRFTVAPLTV